MRKGCLILLIACLPTVTAAAQEILLNDELQSQVKPLQPTTVKEQGDQKNSYLHEAAIFAGLQLPPINLSSSPYNNALGGGALYTLNLGFLGSSWEDFYGGVQVSFYSASSRTSEFGAYTLLMPAVLAGYKYTVYEHSLWNLQAAAETGYSQYFSSFERRNNVSGEFQNFTASRPVLPVSVKLIWSDYKHYTISLALDYLVLFEKTPVHVPGFRIMGGYRF